MLSIDKKVFGLKVREEYFAKSSVEQTEVDLVFTVQAPVVAPVSPWGLIERFKTSLVDLSQSLDLIRLGMAKNTRYEINRAISKDNIVYCIIEQPTRIDIEKFADFFDLFSKAKGLASCNRGKLHLLQEKKALILSESRDEQGASLAFHCYVSDGQRARLLLSVTGVEASGDQERRNLFGRANRLLHWKDIEAFAGLGFKTYDLGGLAFNEADAKLKQINAFKRGFGGREVVEFNVYSAKTLKGSGALILLSCKTGIPFSKFAFRLDDIVPTMDWDKFNRAMAIFSRFGVVPLLGLVPENLDPELVKGPSEEDFWTKMVGLQASGLVELSQHGYQHKYQTKVVGMVGTGFGIKPQSEFAGLSYEQQHSVLAKGRSILEEKGLRTNYFMAPGHTFDLATIRALGDLGFEALTDGISLFPSRIDGMKLVPQQLWKPAWMPFGYWTICLHSNTMTDADFARIERFLEGGAPVVRFTDLVEARVPSLARMLDGLFRAFYLVAVRVKVLLRGRTKPRPASGPSPPS